MITTNPRFYDDAVRFAERLATGALSAAADAIEVAGFEIWMSMLKFGGDPTHRNTHPLSCGCSDCN